MAFGDLVVQYRCILDYSPGILSQDEKILGWHALAADAEAEGQAALEAGQGAFFILQTGYTIAQS